MDRLESFGVVGLRHHTCHVLLPPIDLNPLEGGSIAWSKFSTLRSVPVGVIVRFNDFRLVSEEVVVCEVPHMSCSTTDRPESLGVVGSRHCTCHVLPLIDLNPWVGVDRGAAHAMFCHRLT